VVERPKVVDKR